ncbi:hypothetical protein ACFL35_15030, partial [Candidatus Riflebacteria bacterium]
SIQKAERVVDSMTPAQRNALNNAYINHLPHGNKLAQSSKNLTRFLKNKAVAHKNPALISVIAGFLDAGFYDGLDVMGIKDKLIPPAALMASRNQWQNISGGLGAGIICREVNFMLDSFFEKIYAGALRSARFGPMLTRLDHSVARLGKAIFKADRMGIAGKTGGNELIKKLGLVGVGTGSRLTLKAVTGAVFKGAAFGVGLNFLGETFWNLVIGLPDKGIVGGNRDRQVRLVRFKDAHFQRTGNKWKDFWEERRTCLRNSIGGWQKWPINRLLGSTCGFLGGTMGAVVAGALIVGGGPVVMLGGVLVSALFAGLGGFVGGWLGSKLDRNKAVLKGRKYLWRKGIERRYRKMFIKSGLWADTDASRRRIKYLAKKRVEDVAKLESIGRARRSIRIVRSLDEIKIVRQGAYDYVKIDRNNGGPFFVKAARFHDFIDANGYQGIYDPITRKIVNVGRVQDYSGKNVIVVRKQDIRQDGKNILARQKDANFDYLEDIGVYMHKIKGQWEITGIGVTCDVVVAETGERFEYKNGKLSQCSAVKKTEKEEAEPETVDPGKIEPSISETSKVELFSSKNALARQAFNKFKKLEKDYQKAIEKQDTALMDELFQQMNVAKDRYDNLQVQGDF